MDSDAEESWEDRLPFDLFGEFLMYYPDSDPLEEHPLCDPFGVVVDANDDHDDHDDDDSPEESENWDDSSEDCQCFDPFGHFARGEEGFSHDPNNNGEMRRNWLELPIDVTSLIFMKLSTVDIMLRAQWVCSSWQKISKQPHLYRSIDMMGHWELYDNDEVDMEKMAIAAVERSCGQLVEFSVEHFVSDPVLKSITNNPLRCLRLVGCNQVSEIELIVMAQKLPLLEHLEISHCWFTVEVIEGFGNACLQLKSFRLNCRGFRGPLRFACDGEALAIAKCMPRIQHLHLFGNKMTDIGLQAILDGCAQLQSLDLRHCFSVNLAGDLKTRCADRNIQLKLPNDPTVGYEYSKEVYTIPEEWDLSSDDDYIEDDILIEE